VETKNAKVIGSEHRSDEVTITINNSAVRIHRGRKSVADIKAAGNVPQADELAQEIGGTLTALSDTDSVTIKGGERFVSYPKDSGSSAA
jgi:hypothetical protein